MTSINEYREAIVQATECAKINKCSIIIAVHGGSWASVYKLTLQKLQSVPFCGKNRYVRAVVLLTG